MRLAYKPSDRTNLWKFPQRLLAILLVVILFTRGIYCHVPLQIRSKGLKGRSSGFIDMVVYLFQVKQGQNPLISSVL